MDAATLGTAVTEPALELGAEGADALRRERLGQTDEACEVVLADLLALAEPIRRRLLPALLERQHAHLVGHSASTLAQAAKQEARSVAAKQGGALEGNAGLVERLLEVGQPRVRAAEDRDLLERAGGGANAFDDELGLDLDGHEQAQDRLRAVRELGPQWRRQPVGEREYLGRRAVVLLQADDRRALEALRQREQIRRRRACEAVD